MQEKPSLIYKRIYKTFIGAIINPCIAIFKQTKTAFQRALAISRNKLKVIFATTKAFLYEIYKLPSYIIQGGIIGAQHKQENTKLTQEVAEI